MKNNMKLNDLCHMFQLSDFQAHCLQNAASYLLTNQGNPKEIPSLETAVASFDAPISYPNLQEDFAVAFREMFLAPHAPQTTIWETPLLLHPIVKDFLLADETIPTTVLAKAYHMRFYEMPKTTEVPLVQGRSGAILQLSGAENTGKLYQARLCAAQNEKHLLLVDCKNTTEIVPPQIYLSAQLVGAIPAFCNLDLETNASLELFSYFASHMPFFFVLTEENQHILHIPQNMYVTKYKTKPIDYPEQIAFWKESLSELPTDNSLDIPFLSNRFSFHKGQIKETIDIATISMKLKNMPHLTQELLEEAAQSSCSHLAELGSHKLATNYTWKDMILSQKQKEMLFHACNYIKHKHIVYEDWGYNKNFPYGKNLTVLLEGPPGTGKTMSAQVIANELQLPIYQVNIAQIVSKYIGETEKKLNALFDEAERCNAILFIDEVEAFLAKRTEIKDSHDKYANMETSFLLQKIESFKGILILATNHLEYIDEAFIRRIKFIVSLSMPQKEERLALWKNMFPPQTPLHNVDLDFLAENFQISGGVIKNIVLKSAFLAKSQNKSITMEHVIQSIQNEFMKQGKLLLPTDCKEYGYLLR